MTFADQVTLTYFGIRGRAEPIRLLLEDAGIPYEDRRKFDWKSEKPNREKYPFGQVPAISIGNYHMAQTDAILRYISREYGYYGKTAKDAAIVDMLASAVEDIKIPYLRTVYGGNFEQDKIEFLANRVPNWVANIDAFYEKHGNPFITGENPSFADFLVYEELVCLTYLDEYLLSNYPKLQNLLKKVEGRKNISAYLASGRRPLKVNNVPFGTPQEFLNQLVE